MVETTRSPVRASKRVFVVGNGMTRFLKPGKHSFDYHDLSKIAIERALRDAGIKFEQVQQAYAAYVYGDSCSGQRAIYTVGNTGIPIFNVNNNGATGGTGVYMASRAVASGAADCVLALGFEKMYKGPLKSFFTDRADPLGKFVEHNIALRGPDNSPYAVKMFADAGREHMEKYGSTLDHFSKVAEKNHKHASNNPNSSFRKVYSLREIKNSPMIHSPVQLLACCPNADGAAAAILCSEEFVIRHGLENQAIELCGISLTTDKPDTFGRSSIDLIGGSMTKSAAQEAYQMAGVTADQVNVVELHDCFSANELITYESLGLCEEGKAGEAIDRNDFTYGGRCVVNPSGGLISKGHPLGATGLAQCAELCWQLRGMAEKRQVADARVGMQHNLGLGGACVVAIYKKMRPGVSGKVRPDQTANPDILEQQERDLANARPKL